MDPQGVGSLYQSAPRMKMNAMRDRHPKGAQLISTFLLFAMLFVFGFLSQQFVFAIALLHLHLEFMLGFAECTTHLIFVWMKPQVPTPLAGPWFKFIINAQGITIIVFAFFVHVTMYISFAFVQLDFLVQCCQRFQ